ncbi:hypothetical protein OG616_21475 [Streptomyces antibioticus]|uniref:hypothetical protein n=1 Tax=Streptomyces antibioticus TaxID=1890 RepID=UPI00225841F6|nr:hypothetical protein [Streptomyces antibioticus]MCX5170566.1 hypothetical protein [Streptomyces antibioticus]
MGVRLSGGIGPLRASVPVFGAAGGFFQVCLYSIKLLGWMLWWELVLCWYLLLGCYWLLRLVYWDGPRAAWRWWQRRRAVPAVSGGA